MGVHKATIFFEAGKFGWSETFYKTTNGTIQDTLLSALELVQPRARLCGAHVELSYVRASDDGVRGDSAVVVPDVKVVTLAERALLNAPLNVTLVIPAFGGDAVTDRPYSAVLVRMEDLGGAHHRFMYLRGVPDDLIKGGGVENSKDWESAFVAWTKKLSAGSWSWKAVNRSDDILVNNAVDGLWAAELEGITLALTAVTGLKVGDQVRMRGAVQIGKGYRPNKLYKVTFVSQDLKTIRLVNLNGTIPRVPSNIILRGGFVTKQTVANDLVLIRSASVRAAVRRATGRPFDSPRGRRSARS